MVRKKFFIFLILLIFLFSSQIFAQAEARLPSRDIAPEWKFLWPKPGEKIKGKAEIEGEVENAQAVEFYLSSPLVENPIYLGQASQIEKDRWHFSWDSQQNPNGQYQLLAKIFNPQGEYFSKKISIQIENEIEREMPKEEELKKEIKKAEAEIGKEEEKITEETKKTQTEVINILEGAVEKVGEILEKKERVEVEPQVREKVEKIKEETKKDIENFAEKTKKEEKLKISREKESKKIKEVEEKIRTTERELKEIEEAKEKAKKTGLLEQTEKLKLLEREKKAKLESHQDEIKEVKEELDKIEKEFQDTKKEKEKIKEGVLEKMAKPLKSVEEILPQKERKEQISEITEKVKKETEPFLLELGEMVAQGEKAKKEKSQSLIKDSDNDDLSDAEEIRLGTNPFNSDTDGDSFLDGVEYKIGYDPLKPGPADKVVYSDPRKVKPQKADIYKVERIEVVSLPTAEKGIKIEGKGLPNSFVTVYIFSLPLVMVTRADYNGNWEIVLDKPLTDGTHTVYATVTNNQGEVVARSEAFTFVKSGDKVAEITLSTLITPEILSPAQALERSFFILIVAVIILAIGLALIIIGVLTRKKLLR